MHGTSDRHQTYLIEGSNGSVIRLSATAHFVLTSLDGGATAEQTAVQLGERLGRTITAGHVEAAYAQVRQQVDEISQRTRRPKPYGLWFRVRLLPIAAVSQLSRWLSSAFRPVLALPLLAVVVVAAIPTFAAGRASHQK
jgi:hypothetical protein